MSDSTLPGASDRQPGALSPYWERVAEERREAHAAEQTAATRSDGWTKLPPLAHAPHSGCLNCVAKPLRVKLNVRMHAGFGVTSLRRDGETVEQFFDYEDCPTFQRFENVARKDPDHDWRVKVDGPLSDVTYQRQGLNEWVAVEKGMGFA